MARSIAHVQPEKMNNDMRYKRAHFAGKKIKQLLNSEKIIIKPNIYFSTWKKRS